MKVAMWHGAGKFVIEEKPDPSPGPGQVVIKVDTVGVCGTDVHITQGLFPATAPSVLGHEFSGTIAATGKGVGRRRVGEQVVCDITSHCGKCANCREWTISRCENSQRSSGALAEFSVVPAQSAHRLPEGLDLETAALTEPASCCLSGSEMWPMPKDAVVLVIGGGIMGQFTVAFLKRRGAKTVILSEPVASRRELGRQMGADVLNDPRAEDLGEVVMRETNGRGVHIAAEVVGKTELVGRCIELTRPRGNVLMIGVCPQKSILPTDMYDFHYREIGLRGAFGRGNCFKRTLHVLPELNLNGVISARYPLERTYDAIYDSGQGRGVKLVVKPNGI
ncbi:MAG: alcohol dehydrogenase catalytic domain-containing protein [Chloroflexi bacterium]|nr:alcohol dehydrogenase catalytic domain-containing protein [Chloroflexota bacterium]